MRKFILQTQIHTQHYQQTLRLKRPHNEKGLGTIAFDIFFFPPSIDFGHTIEMDSYYTLGSNIHV